MLSSLRRFRDARRHLKKTFSVERDFRELEESCIPSYTHARPLMGWIAWQRLERALALWRRHGAPAEVLDFGAGSGILGRLLPSDVPYCFAEINEMLADRIREANPSATRVDLPTTDRRFGTIFALDSLEHNENVADLLRLIHDRLAPEGIFILSGPSENAIYRLGRRLAGFRGGYHHQTIYDIEAAARELMTPVAVRQVPCGMPLFRVSVWRRRRP